MGRAAQAATGALGVGRQAERAGVPPRKMAAVKMAVVKAVAVKAVRAKAEGKAQGVKVVAQVEAFGNSD